MSSRAAPWRDTELRKYTAPAIGNLLAGTFPTWNNFKPLFITCWGDLNIPAKALATLQNFKFDKSRWLTLTQIITQLDTLLGEAGVTDEQQKKAYLQQALPDEYKKFLAYTRSATYAQAVEDIRGYETELTRTPGTILPTAACPEKDPWAMDVD
jgi:hypothetical protein